MAANEIMQPIHERMPLILKSGRDKEWLHPGGVTVFPRSRPNS
jgi:putative SOS response-associated peptidase YedK